MFINNFQGTKVRKKMISFIIEVNNVFNFLFFIPVFAPAG